MLVYIRNGYDPERHVRLDLLLIVLTKKRPTCGEDQRLSEVLLSHQVIGDRQHFEARSLPKTPHSKMVGQGADQDRNYLSASGDKPSG